MGKVPTTLKNCRILVVCESLIIVFQIFCMVYLIGLPVTNIRRELTFYLKVLVVTNYVPCRKTTFLQVEELFIAYELLGLFAVDITNDCKYRPQFMNVTE